MTGSWLTLNNGHLHEAQGALSELSHCSYLFHDDGEESCIRGCYGGSTVVACKLKELDGGVDVYIGIPAAVRCDHLFRAGVTHSIRSTVDSHLTYHGRTAGKKESGEVHLVVDGRNVLKGRANVLEAPLAHSDDLTIFPLPICRLELAESVGTVSTRAEIRNYFELLGPACFFNTLDVYLARRGFMTSLLNGSARIPNVVASVFASTTLEVFKTGRLTRRRGRFPQVLVLQSKRHELIIFAMQEAQHVRYSASALIYFHSRDYLRRLFNRLTLQHEGGYFIDLFESEAGNKPGFYRILDAL
ncbi:MAG: hypothetical protein ACYC5V_04175 [Gemmatimonadaceae bacterium]